MALRDVIPLDSREALSKQRDALSCAAVAAAAVAFSIETLISSLTPSFPFLSSTLSLLNQLFSRQDLQEAAPSVREGAPGRRAQARRRVWPSQQARALARADGFVQDPTGKEEGIGLCFRKGHAGEARKAAG